MIREFTSNYRRSSVITTLLLPHNTKVAIDKELLFELRSLHIVGEQIIQRTLMVFISVF